MIQLPWPKQYQDSLQLLGRGPDGWIVDYHHTATLFEVARNGTAHMLFHYTQDGGYEGFANVTLSTNHKLIAIRAADPADAAHYTVYDLAGFVVDTHSFGFGWLVTFRGTSIYFPKTLSSTRTKLVRWTMGSDPVDTGLRNVTLLDLAHDQFVKQAYVVPHYLDKLASASQPSNVRWSLCTDCHGQDLTSRVFSPDGTRLAYFHGSSRVTALQRATIRATSDGHVITDLRFNAKVWVERWEDARHLLVEVIRPQP